MKAQTEKVVRVTDVDIHHIARDMKTFIVRVVISHIESSPSNAVDHVRWSTRRCVWNGVEQGTCAPSHTDGFRKRVGGESPI